MAYPEKLLVGGERVLVHLRPHWRMLVLPVLVPPVAAGLAAWLAALSRAAAWRGPIWVALAVLALVAVAWFSLAPVLRWRSTHFVVTDRRVLVREGVLTRVGIEVAGSAVAGVHTRQRVLERLLGCGTLVVGVDHAEDPWEFDGLGDLVRTAAVLERVALEQGGEPRAPRAGGDGPDDGPDGGPDDGLPGEEPFLDDAGYGADPVADTGPAAVRGPRRARSRRS